MKLKRKILSAAAALCAVCLTACGVPIEPVAESPEYTIITTVETTTGTLPAATAQLTLGKTTATSTVTTTVKTKPEFMSLTFTRNEILEAAKFKEAYKSYGYVDVDNVSCNLGTVNIVRDSGAYTIPDGYGLHYVSDIIVEDAPKGETISVTGTAYVRVLEEIPADDGTMQQAVTVVATAKFTILKYAK